MVTGLGSLESEVMEALWASPSSLSVRQVLDSLPREGIAYTTISTVLENLRRKGWVRRERLGRLWFYQPIRDRSTHAAEQMRDALEGSRDAGATLLRFVDGMRPDEVRTLRSLLAELPEEEP
ncbi:BlaI/MecI/CopY family transcriptional regulator [Nocardiopsis alkaliphila]|uniref:BlaI/MecI/CopY family transcriptional regulator n=1 Tax=Nocardiopsis alkaliphila TaxID=225762 RepID=UPI00034DD162|nr:BlaI/MecI/CopY family transcriptional regulator [Nocardiopsis alkaliphila]